MADKSYALADFLLNEMKQRNMSQREFARFIGVSHVTVGRYISEDLPVPSEDFLIKLSDATGANLEALFALAFPRVAAKTALSPRAVLLAQKFDLLPEDIQDFIMSAVSK